MAIYTSTGWAVRTTEEILVSTVSPTRRGALVRYLQGHAQLIPDLSIWTDEDIETAWERIRKDAEVVPVSIQSVQ